MMWNRVIAILNPTKSQRTHPNKIHPIKCLNFFCDHKQLVRHRHYDLMPNLLVELKNNNELYGSTYTTESGWFVLLLRLLNLGQII